MSRAGGGPGALLIEVSTSSLAQDPSLRLQVLPVADFSGWMAFFWAPRTGRTPACDQTLPLLPLSSLAPSRQAGLRFPVCRG